MHWFVSLSAALAESESDVKLVQSCQSAPTTLVTGTTEPSCTRDAGQQTSEMLLMPPAAVTETVWTLTDPDEATTSTNAEYPTPRGVPADDDAVASAETSPHPTKPATSAAAAAAETQSVDDISTEVQLSHTDTMAITNVDAVAADQRNKVTITKDQDKADETLLTTLNRRPTTDIYEDWSTSLAIAGKV